MRPRVVAAETNSSCGPYKVCTGAATGSATSFNRNTDAPDFNKDGINNDGSVTEALPVPFVQEVTPASSTGRVDAAATTWIVRVCVDAAATTWIFVFAQIAMTFGFCITVLAYATGTTHRAEEMGSRRRRGTHLETTFR